MSTKNANNRVSAWADVGRTWSKFGRAIGKVALENVAEALKKTAQALDTPNDAPGGKSNRRDESTVKTPQDNG
jgi:hypothetical protein